MYGSIVSKVESILASFYGFDPQVKASDFIMKAVKDEPRSETGRFDLERPATIFQHEKGELDIGIYVPSKNFAPESCPLESLNIRNLDYYCAISEEVSHFHFIINRYNNSKTFSLLELEWQGEVDRFLCASVLLHEQCGHSHHHHLFALFSSAGLNCHPDLRERYEEAGRLALMFLKNTITPIFGKNPFGKKAIQSRMRDAYSAEWSAKVGLSKKRVG